jgi:hypothetical protein
VNRDQAYALVHQTFTHAFDRSRFVNFTRNLVNHLDIGKAELWNGGSVKDAFRRHVQRYERVGTYTSPDGEKLDVLVVHLTKNSKIERARTAIRNFVADHLKARDERDAALVAFVSPSESQWRFSYVKMEYATVESESGKVGVEARLTPARRFSYIVGEGESCHTAQTRFLHLLQETAANPTLGDLEVAFSVEAVTKEFFTRYAGLFEEINTALDSLVAKDSAIRAEFKAKAVRTVDFAKKLMGQIVFLYFLQKKGWLGVAKRADWGTGPHDFMRRLAKGEYGRYGNFFNDALEPLFYDTLATDRGREAWCDRLQCRIPFLNGGLFESLGDYAWWKTDVLIPNRLFTNTDPVEQGITGTGILDVFDRFNFTVNEAEPLETEVAIDPEMLGKVFENLIEANRRKGVGAYYTPREIVHYMCQESLIGYLDAVVNTHEVALRPANASQVNLFGGRAAEQTALKVTEYKEIVSRKDLETFIHLGEQISHYEAAETSDAIKMPRAIGLHAQLIDDSLAKVTVCDPAVGSGAFPVGMMTEIVSARSALTPYFSGTRERTPYHFKSHAIQHCLYGVDIDPGAVEIAKLRLWLSLVVDEQETKEIKPLPNLDYKVVRGNSLLGFPFRSPRLHEIAKLQADVVGESDHTAKARLKRQIDIKLAQSIAASKKSLGYEVTFDFETWFSEVFRNRGGFDIIIANPPYGADLTDRERQTLAERFPFVPDFESADYFICIALEKLRAGGTKCFIVPNTWLVNRFARRFRRHLLDRYALSSIGDCSGFSVFDSASVRNSLTLISRATPPANYAVRFVVLEPVRGPARMIEVTSTMLLAGLDNWLAYFSAADSRLILANKIRQGARPLGDFTDSSQGLIPYDKYRGHDEQTIRNRIWHADFKRDKTYRRELQGRDVNRYSVTWNGETWISYGRWLAAPREQRFFTSERILIREITNPRILAAYTSDEFYNTPSIINVTAFRGLHPLYVLGLLNSNLLSFYHVETSPKSKKGLFPKILVNDVRSLPIKEGSPEVERRVVRLVERILSAKSRDPGADTTSWERGIDQLVYELYGLTPEEIGLVEGALAKSEAGEGKDIGIKGWKP